MKGVKFYKVVDILNQNLLDSDYSLNKTVGVSKGAFYVDGNLIPGFVDVTQKTKRTVSLDIDGRILDCDMNTAYGDWTGRIIAREDSVFFDENDKAYVLRDDYIVIGNEEFIVGRLEGMLDGKGVTLSPFERKVLEKDVAKYNDKQAEYLEKSLVDVVRIYTN